MGVDQTGRDQLAARLDQLCVWCNDPLPDCRNDTIAHKDITPRNLAPRVIHGNDDVGLSDQEISHPLRL